MKQKLILGLALSAAMLVVVQPSYAFKRSSGSGGGAKAEVHAAAPHVAAVHSRSFAPRSGGGNFVAHNSVNRSFNRNLAASHGSPPRNNAVANSHNFTGKQNRNSTASRNFNRGSNHSSVAFGGSGNNRNSHGTYAFASHSGWSHNREYFWSGHHYRWYDNAWFVVDPYPYGYGYYGPDYGYNNNYGAAPVGTQVQAALQQQGYYQGPVDGIVGPGTSAAIAHYQQDNGLRVTGTITNGLLYNLGIG